MTGVMNIAEFKKLNFDAQLEQIKRELSDKQARHLLSNVRVATRQEDEGDDDISYRFTGIASGESAPRGDFWGIDIAGLDLTEFRNNPAILPMHTQDADVLPIGRASRIEYVNGRVEIDFELDRDDVRAQEYARKINAGYLNALSIGFSIDFDSAEELPDGTIIFRNTQLTEVSVVGVGHDPTALVEVARGLGASGADGVIEAYQAWKSEQDTEGSVIIRTATGDDVPTVECMDAERTSQTEDDVVELTAEIAHLRSEIDDLMGVVSEQSARIDDLNTQLETERGLRKSEDTANSKRITELYSVIPDFEAERTRKLNKAMENLK